MSACRSPTSASVAPVSSTLHLAAASPASEALPAAAARSHLLHSTSRAAAAAPRLAKATNRAHALEIATAPRSFIPGTRRPLRAPARTSRASHYAPCTRERTAVSISPRDGHPLAFRPAAPPALRMRSRTASGTRAIPGTSLWRNSAFRWLASGRMPTSTGRSSGAISSRNQGPWDHRLRHHQLRAGGLLLSEARDLALVVERGRLGPGGEDERGAAPQRLPAGVDADVEPGGELEDADGVEVVDGGGVGEIADLGRVAGDDDQVSHAEIVRAEEVRQRGQGFRSRPQTWRMVSQPTSRWILAIARFPIRACARAPSAMLMTSMPPLISILAAATAFAGSSPMGGLTSTEVTNFFCASFAASRLFAEKAVGSMNGATGPGAADHPTAETSPRSSLVGASTSAPPTILAAAAIRFTCSGVVPQQPPTRCTPSLKRRRA